MAGGTTEAGAASGDQPGGPSHDDFAHLHLHTQYSLLDGAIRVKDLCKTVKERGMSSVAVTDHGNMFGAVQFYQEAKAQGIKPIFGSEVYVAASDMTEKKERRSYHQVLLARNETGYRNLQRLVSFGHLRGFYYHPRVDRKVLREHREGLIGLSGCLGGHVSKLVMANDMDAARARVLEYKDIFEPGMFFLELQQTGKEEQERVNAALAQLSADLDVPLVATNNCHYINRDEAHAHEVLTCMGQGRTLDDPKRMRRGTDALFIKTAAEMQSAFRQFPGAYENACRIASLCEVELHLGSPELPDFQLPQGCDDDLPTYLRRVVLQGLEERFAELRALEIPFDVDEYRARVEHELKIIISMKFPGYFLIVWDFIRKAKEIDVPVGPGRGSGAGSLVAYSLRITDIDPMQYNLLFERFLNPERVSMPDFDIDFCMDRRGQVIDYVTGRYGAERVGQIATFHSLKARGLVRDVCRVKGVSVAEANELAKMIPEGPKVTLSLAMADPEPLKKEAKKNPAKAGKLRGKIEIAEAAYKLRRRAGEDDRVKDVLDVGMKLEGLYRHAGMHAAGVVIGNRDLWEHVPCFQNDGQIVTQYTMNDVERAGLVKFDFLGLKTLTVLKTAVDLVNEGRPKDDPLVLASVAMDDAGVYEMISRGETTGVFQLESSGFKELLKKLKPDRFEDIIAAVALYRPGPLEGGMVDQFIECKHGRREVEYPHALLEDVLKETYGVFVYQEQVMQAAQILAGFTLGGADLMRRAMGKKKVAEMERQRKLFVDGCETVSNISAEKANEIFDLIDKFAGYGFNKSHSAAYGLITYHTGYLKHHYPVAFMAALMTCDKHNNDNVVKFIAEARAMGITVLQPDVNESGRDFSVVRRPLTEEQVAKLKRTRKRVRVPKDAANRPVEELIRFGLGAVRNVGETAVDSILAARKDEGAFKNIFDLCRRVDLKRVNKRTLEGLTYAGAFDGVSDGNHRAAIMGAVESAVDQGQSAQRDRESGQNSLFAVLGTPTAEYVERYPTLEEWDPRQKLLHEREALGFYLTGHPLDRFKQDINRHATCRTGDLNVKHDNTDVRIAGVICEFKEIQTKSGKGPMCFFQVEDQFGRVEGIVFPKSYARVDDEASGETFGDRLQKIGDDPVLVTGCVEVEINDEGDVGRTKLLVESVLTLADVRAQSTAKLQLAMTIPQLTERVHRKLESLLREFNGRCPVEALVTMPDRYVARVRLGVGVSPVDKLLHQLEKLFGKNAVKLDQSGEISLPELNRERKRSWRRKPKGKKAG